MALKLPALDPRGEVWRERFRRERDILAKLEHPHIARLYDAGVTDAGQPWLAMEFVEGLSLTQHVASRAHSLAARLALFRQVLAAVAHAHRHLVVHRDLKPANIMVDASGQVKLLDFGIARLVDEAGGGDAGGELTRSGARGMTPRYAAPEQVDGGGITTATDIYALGVILQEILTGVARGPWARLRADDLEAIILKAMRREPGERYASVETFAADILAHLEKRPVAARAGTWRYLAGRFAVRHKLPLAMAAAVLATLLAGLVVADRERRVAVAEKARAERHFASVRKLANAFVFDVQREIEHLPGALKARQTLVGTAVQYLDSLADESRTDTALAVEVAGAYRRLAEISGDSRSAHLGDFAGARRNAKRAAALLEAVEAGEPGHIEALREHRVLALLLGRLRLEGGDSGGVDETAKAVRIAEKITTLPAAGIGDRRNLGATLAEYGGILAIVRDDHAAAAVQLARAIEELEAVTRENPADVASRASLAFAYDRGAAGTEATGRDDLLPRANELMEKSIAATQSVMRDDAPRAVSYAQALAKRYNNSARVKIKMGDLAGGREKAILGLGLVERLLAADPRNVNNATIHVGALSTLSGLEHLDGRHGKAIEFARAAIAADARLPAETRRGLIVRENVMSARRALGASACACARAKPLLEEGQAMLLESRLFKRELVERGIDAREAQSTIREIDADLARCDQALARLKPA